MARRSLSLGLIVVTVVLAWPWLASAQQRDHDPYVSIFGGMAFPNKTDVPITSPTTNATLLGVTLDDSASWGGKAGVWFNQFRDALPMDLDFGLQLDVTNYYPSQGGGQSVGASGSILGIPAVSGTTSQVNFQSTVFAVNFLTRVPMAVSPEYPNGEWFPYLGVGIGMQRTAYTATGGSGEAWDHAYQALGGVQYMLTPAIGLYAEYKYTMSEQLIRNIGTQDGRYDFNVSHIVAGLAWHF